MAISKVLASHILVPVSAPVTVTCNFTSSALLGRGGTGARPAHPGNEPQKSLGTKLLSLMLQLLESLWS